MPAECSFDYLPMSRRGWAAFPAGYVDLPLMLGSLPSETEGKANRPRRCVTRGDLVCRHARANPPGGLGLDDLSRQVFEKAGPAARIPTCFGGWPAGRRSTGG